MTGKKLLRIHDQALQSIFGQSAHDYVDLWKENGEIEKKIDLAKSTKIATAKRHFEHLLNLCKIYRLRQSQGRVLDKLHQAMMDGLARLYVAIELRRQ